MTQQTAVEMTNLSNALQETIEIRPINYLDDPHALVAADLLYGMVLRGLDPGDNAAHAYHLRATDAHTFCAVDSGGQRLLGVAALYLADNLDSVGFVEDVAVVEVAQRQGVGARLLTHVERQAQVAGLVTLRLTSLQRALPFYHKLGYMPRSSSRPYDLEKQLPDV